MYSEQVETALAGLIERARSAGDRDVPVLWPTYSDFRAFWTEHGGGEPWEPAWRRVEAAVSERLDRNAYARAKARAVTGEVAAVAIPHWTGNV